MKAAYESCLKRLSIESSVDKYKTYHLNEIVSLWSKHFVIMNHDLQVLIEKQNIARTKNTVIKLLSVHRKHFT